MNENKLITELRGLAAIMVMLFHFVCVSNNFLNSSNVITLFSFAKHGVQMFFVISGYILTVSLIRGNYCLKNILQFLLKRIIRIEPPYIISLIIILSILTLKGYYKGFGFDHYLNLSQVFFHLGYLIPFSNYQWLNIVYWTLAVEFQFYFLLAIIFPLLTKTKKSRVIVLLLISLLYFLQYSLPKIELFFWIPIFISGICLAFLTNDKSRKENKLLIPLIVLLDILILKEYGLTIGIIVLFSQLLIFKGKSFNNNILYQLGEISYSIYLIHTTIGFSLMNFTSRFSESSIFRFFMFVIISLLTILVSFYFNKFLEKPFQRISSKLNYK